MSDLSNLYISQSYKGLINLADSTEGITSQSNYELQDGLGVGIGVSITGSSLLVENDISSSTLNGMGNVETFSASVDLRLDEVEATASDHDKRVDAIELYTSSLREAVSVTGSNANFSGDVTISGSLTAHEIHTITESASVIFSSGSNILGDEPSDTQTLSGSVYVPNLHYLAFNSLDTNLRINQKLDTGSFLIFSESVDNQLEQIVQDALPSSWTGSVFEPFSSSVSQQIDALELFSQSLVLDTASFSQWTASVFEPYSTSVDERLLIQSTEIDTKLDSASFENWTSSVYEPFSSSVDFRLDDLASFTGSYATTGSNLFRGNQIISGSTIIQDVNPAPGTTFEVRAGGASPAIQIVNNALGSIVGSDYILNGTGLINGNNTFNGNQTISGSQFTSGSLILDGKLTVTTSASIDGGWHVTGSSHYSGSVKGNVLFDSSSTSDPSDFTHSIDCSLGNFFDIYLKEGENLVTADNIYGGETITVRLNQPSGSQVANYGEVVWDTGSIKFPFTSNPQTTQGSNAIDVLTLVSFDTGSLFGVLGKNYL